jgi:hypothetical protein
MGDPISLVLDPGDWFVVLQDPEGNEFRLV